MSSVGSPYATGLSCLLLGACALHTNSLGPVVTPAGFTDPDMGIGRSLAETRANNVSKVRYQLRFQIAKGMAAVRGQVTARFTLKSAQPIVLDWDGPPLSDVALNGESANARKVANHLVFTGGVAGENSIHATFTSKVAPTGTPLTVYRDKTDGAEYYYTLVVPADCHRLFPCFDQPDLKAVYSLSVEAPESWKVIANGMGGVFHPGKPSAPGNLVHDFVSTKPLSTYLFAFAAGPFQELEGPSLKIDGRSGVPLHAYVRKSKLDKFETKLLFEMHRDAVHWLGDYFAYPYPFQKLDMVLLPGFPYGGMEHAGAIFYRESALVFEQAPTEGELSRRSTLIYHEVSHQWFGNLVTMKWFDDLWLKEGFATFMGYTLFETLEPGKHAWLRFHHRVKPRAYAVDGTSGTTPVYQELANLADAKSAYGAIVYNKAPAIIRELNHRLGPSTFQRGLQLFLKEYQFANATWRDLVKSLETASEESAAPWSNRWILAAGMPRVRARWSKSGDTIASLHVHQESVQGDAGTWPLQLEVMLLDADGSHRKTKIVADDADTRLPEFEGQAAPACVLLNPGDIAYGQFLLDETSQAWLIDHVQDIRDPLVRAVAMSALYETVREAQLNPARYADAALRLLEIETDAGTHAWLLSTLSTSLRRYMPATLSAPRLAQLSGVLRTQLAGKVDGIKTQTLRALMRMCTDPQAMAICESAAQAKAPAKGMIIGKRDRFLAATALVGAGRGQKVLDQVVAAFGDEDVAREAFIAAAANPSAKAEYFAAYSKLDDPPEQWMSSSLGSFHWPGQHKSTLPFLRSALDRVEWVKKNRKIFFMPAWIDAFVNGHSSQDALDIVREFLAERHDDLSIDIRRKILQSLDHLQRSVEIKKRWN